MIHNKRCYGCDRSCNNLLTANCGHKTCFYCIKNNKSAHKCSKCSQEQVHRSPSPLKSKSIERSSHQISTDKNRQKEQSPLPDTDRHIQSTQKKEPIMRNEGMKLPADCLICLQHRQPLSMFCKSTKEILCSICLCKKPKYNQQLMPLRNAEQYLKKQTRVNREEARIAQSDVENAWRVVNKNRQAIEQTIETNTFLIQEYFKCLTEKLKEIQENSIKICTQFLQNKMNEYGEISEDLHYLGETLREFRFNCKENTSLNDLTYFYSSFKVIKKTIKSLSFDYIPYENNDIRIVEFDRDLTERVERELVKFKLSLPIKAHEKNKSRSASTKNTKTRVSPDYLLKNKHKISNSQSASDKKHKFSLCSNGSVDYGVSEENLYKQLLKAKYKF